MRRILLIEDTDRHARLVERYVAQFDGPPVAVARAASLREGLDRLASKKYDAVLLDLSLPDSDWRETLSVVVEAAPRVPIVVLTSHGDLELAASAVAGGAEDYVVKSALTAEVLQRALRYAIERKKVKESLRRRRKELEQSNEALKHFAHTVAHELRQPLNTSSLHVGLLQRHVEKGEAGLADALDSLESLRDALRGMNGVISDLLTFASVQSDEGIEDDCDVEALLEQVLDDLAPEAGEAGASISVGPMPRVPCNPRYLRHVFRNLLSNSLRYRRELPPEIRIEAEDTGEAWRFSVVDNGIGIPDDERDVVFEMFKRSRAHLHLEGSGIGLALCRRIVEHHGGQIGVESRCGEGTSLHFTLPKAAIRPGA